MTRPHAGSHDGSGASVRLARVIEADCIGCTRCIQVCPVDAIVGAAGHMHTVVTAWCSGCDRCAPVCPTDCIAMEPLADPAPAARATLAEQRAARRDARLARGAAGRATPLLEVSTASAGELRAAVLAAVARRRAARP